MIIAIIPVAFMLVGALLWGLVSSPPVKEMGRILFGVGAFWLCYALLGRTWRIG